MVVETVRGGLGSSRTDEEKLAISEGHLQALTVRAYGGDFIEKYRNGNLLTFEALRDASGANVVAASSLQNFERKWIGHYAPGVHWEILEGFPIVSDDADIDKVLKFKSEYGGQLKCLNDFLIGKVEQINGSETPAAKAADVQKEIADKLAKLRSLLDEKGIAYRIGSLKISLEVGRFLPELLSLGGFEELKRFQFT